MFVLDTRNTLCLRDKVRQTSLGKSAAGVDLWSARQPLTSHWMSAGLYRVTTKCSYYNKSSIGVSYTSVQFEWDPFVNKDARSSWVTGTGPMRHKYQPRPMCFPWCFCLLSRMGFLQKYYHTLRTKKLLGGIFVCPSVRLSVPSSVRPSFQHSVSALYCLQFWLDPFHILTSYQATSEGVSHVKFRSKFGFLAIFLNL